MSATETLPQRLSRLIEERGTNAYALSLAAGLNPTAVRDIIEQRVKRPLHTTIRALAQQLRVSPEYLATGAEDGKEQPSEVDSLSAKERDLLTAFRRLSPRRQRAFLDILASTESQDHPE